MSELVRIGDTALFRGNIRDKEKRLLLLSEVKKLRLSDNYKSVYIQRDLTFRQRQEMVSRRSALSGSRHGVGHGGSTGLRVLVVLFVGFLICVVVLAWVADLWLLLLLRNVWMRSQLH